MLVSINSIKDAQNFLNLIEFKANGTYNYQILVPLGKDNELIKHSYLFNESSTDFTRIQSASKFNTMVNNHTLMFKGQTCRFEFNYQFNGTNYSYSLDFEGGKFGQTFNKIVRFVAQKVLKELTTSNDEHIKEYVKTRTAEISDLIFGEKNLIEAIVIVLGLQKLDRVQMNTIAYLIEPNYDKEGVLIGFEPSKTMEKVLNAQKPKSELSKLTIKELRQIANSKNIEIPKKVKKTELVNLLQD